VSPRRATSGRGLRAKGGASSGRAYRRSDRAWTTVCSTPLTEPMHHLYSSSTVTGYLELAVPSACLRLWLALSRHSARGDEVRSSRHRRGGSHRRRSRGGAGFVAQHHARRNRCDELCSSCTHTHAASSCEEAVTAFAGCRSRLDASCTRAFRESASLCVRFESPGHSATRCSLP